MLIRYPAAKRLWQRALLVGILALGVVLTACAADTSSDTNPPPNCDNGIMVPITVKRDGAGITLLVAVRIKGQGPYTFVIDTGASRSIIDSNVASALGLPVAASGITLNGVSGSQTVDAVRVSQWSMGDVRLPASTILAANIGDESAKLGRSGLIGSDVLAAFGIVTMDYSTKKMVVYHQIVNVSAVPTAAPVTGQSVLVPQAGTSARIGVGSVIW